ncbi:precorrin-3B synthase [Jatrophihabitans fulvus]
MPTDDRCPGVLRTLDAADGRLARVRLPGGLLDATQLRGLADVTDEFGDGRLELTSRGNVQVRGLRASATSAFEAAVAAAGLLPTPSRDQVRNVLASALAGIDTPLSLVPFVRALDVALRTEPGLDELSGRFLFGLDDGRGDVAGLRPDVLTVVSSADVPEDVAAAMIDSARAFLASSDGAWRRPVAERTWSLPPTGAPPLGPVGAGLVVSPPLGRVTSEQARWLAGHADEVRVTPWRSLVLPVAPSADPSAAGFVTEPDSPWRLVSACAGRPRCAKALADVQADAERHLGTHPGARLHWAGCERCCGRTADVDVTLIATATGYRTEPAHA